MKTLLRIILVFVTVIITSHYINFNEEPPIRYINFELPDKMMAVTIPPFGILISNKYQSEGGGPGTVLAHEKIHWLQYNELGLVNFYYYYITDFVKCGRINHPMEVDARDRSK
jgi:hypothetical protein|tara:strand:- start:357 stop:695 length:339 start_codon:yes stop_codon:yes gene_type:complete